MNNVFNNALLGFSRQELATEEQVDENFNQTVLLLHGDGTNGAQNNTFLDSSTNNFTITRNGNTTQGTFSPFSVGESEWSNYFDGTDDFLQIGTTNAAVSWLNTSGSTGCIEAWVYPTLFRAGAVGSPNYTYPAILGLGGTYLNLGVDNGTPKLYWWTGAQNNLTSSTSISLNAWSHIALTFNGGGSNNIKMYVNGILSATGTFTNINWGTAASGNILQVGREVSSPATSCWVGYISNLRIVNGSAVYTENFTPSTEPFTAISGTTALTCQSKRFVDNSANNYAITVGGGAPKVTPFSPFAPTASYSESVNGGSGYFDGTGDYLDVAQTSALALTGDFTIELWWYATATTNPGYLFDFRSSGPTTLAYIYQNDKIDFYLNSFQYITSLGETSPYNRWNHFVATRSGTTLSLYHNGIRVNTGTNSSTGSNSTCRIGARFSAEEIWNGYISNFRIVNGSSVYDPTQTTITVPTQPLTNITNTSLLLNFTNAGIFDNTGKNVIETTGSAAISTTVVKYGTGSIYFAGDNNSNLIIPPSPDRLMTGDFTFEFWHRTGTSQLNTYSGIATPTRSKTAPDLGVYMTSGYIYFEIASSGGASTTTNQLDNTFRHVALTRSGSTLRAFVNGVLEGSSTYSGLVDIGAASSYRFGRGWNSDNRWSGYLDDIRIINGIAKYTENFTPPPQPFPDL